MKPTEGVSYAAILKDLKKHVKPDELGVTVHGIRETRSKDLLVELKCSKEGRRRLDTALKEVIGASGTVRYLIPRIYIYITFRSTNLWFRNFHQLLLNNKRKLLIEGFKESSGHKNRHFLYLLRFVILMLPSKKICFLKFTYFMRFLEFAGRYVVN